MLRSSLTIAGAVAVLALAGTADVAAAGRPVALARQVQAAQAGDQAAAPATQATTKKPATRRAAQPTIDAEGYHLATRLGGPTRIYPGRLKSMADLRVMAGNRTVQRELWAVMEKAELTPLAPDVLKALASASPDLLTETTFPVAGTMEWMAARKSRNEVDIIRKVRWGGKQPFNVWVFFIDDGKTGYRFAIAKPCGNLMFLGTAPSPIAEAVLAEERRAAKVKPPVVVPPPPPPPPPAPVPPPPPEQRFDEQARAAGALATIEERQRDFLDPFVEFGVGKIRGRSLHDCPSDLIKCQVQSVLKGGVDVRLAGPLRLAPALGIAINLHNRKNSALFADLELNYWFDDKKGFIGSGVGIWDITHQETRTGAILAQGGVRVWKSDATGSGLYFILSGRVFTATLDDIGNHYSFWGGFRFVIR